MIRHLAHCCLVARDLEASERFYVEVLGLQRRFRFVRGEQVIGFYLSIDEHSFIEVFAGDSAAADGAQRIRHLCLEVDDIDALEARLQAHGVATRGKKRGADGNMQLWCQDPDGVDIEFQQYADDCCQRTGAYCVVYW